MKKLLAILVGFLVMFSPLTLAQVEGDLFIEVYEGSFWDYISSFFKDLKFAITVTPVHIVKGHHGTLTGYITVNQEPENGRVCVVALARKSSGSVNRIGVNCVNAHQWDQINFYFIVKTEQAWYEIGDINYKVFVSDDENNLQGGWEWYAPNMGYDSKSSSIIAEGKECSPNGIIGNSWCEGTGKRIWEVCENYDWARHSEWCPSGTQCVYRPDDAKASCQEACQFLHVKRTWCKNDITACREVCQKGTPNYYKEICNNCANYDKVCVNGACVEEGVPTTTTTTTTVETTTTIDWWETTTTTIEEITTTTIEVFVWAIREGVCGVYKEVEVPSYITSYATEAECLAAIAAGVTEEDWEPIGIDRRIIVVGIIAAILLVLLGVGLLFKKKKKK